jgi:hypothetical protein
MYVTGMSGFSMGGVHASMVASLYPGPVACTPLLAPRSASVAFCSGALWDATAWRPLLSPEDQNHRVTISHPILYHRERIFPWGGGSHQCEVLWPADIVARQSNWESNSCFTSTQRVSGWS